jgi:putative endopeptidase
VDNLLATFAERIQQLDWMSDSTKQKALVKLHAMVKKLVIPTDERLFIHYNHP